MDSPTSTLGNMRANGVRAIAVYCGLAALLLVATVLSARAYEMPYDPYPWCAEYWDGPGGGGTDWGFLSIEQCRASVMRRRRLLRAQPILQSAPLAVARVSAQAALTMRQATAPMTLGNMRQDGARTLAIHCGGHWCNHEAILDVLDASSYADDVAVPAFGPRTVCTVCGAIGVDGQPNWNERAPVCLFATKH
jgi:hypothetical protein